MQINRTNRLMIIPCIIWLLEVKSVFGFANTFATKNVINKPRSNKHLSFRSISSQRQNFLKNLISEAFENDSNLDKGSIEGSIEGPNDEYDPQTRRSPLTKVQQEWRAKQSGAVMSSKVLDNINLDLDFFLTGIPSRDPSNDLFASRTNVSTRDRDVGLTIPEKPTVQGVTIQFLDNDICRCINSEETSFISDEMDGEWKLSDDGKMIRFSVHVEGYMRTVQTKGSIQKIYWSDEPEATRQTSTEYSIPQGYIYCDTEIENRAGRLNFKDGIVRVQQSSGLLGAGTKMVPCGKFTASPKITDTISTESNKKMIGGDV